MRQRRPRKIVDRPEGTKFARVHLENWRNFKWVDVPLQNRAFLVGPNASGKSNFLDALRFLRDLVAPGGGFQQSVKDRGGTSSIRSLTGSQQSVVAVEVKLHIEGRGWRYRIAFAEDDRKLPTLKEEKVWHGEDLILDRPNQDDLDDEESLRQTYLEQTIANRQFRVVADFVASVRYYHIVPQLVRDPERFRSWKADPYGADFLDQIANTEPPTREARLRRISSALKFAVPQFGELKLGEDDRGMPHLYATYQHWPTWEAQQTEADFSDGTLRLIGLLWSLLDGHGPLLLEEPELSLHPGVVRHIPQMMWRLQRGDDGQEVRQVLLSTHSSDLLRDEGIAADEVLLVTLSEEGSTVRIGADIDEVEQLLKAGLTPAEVVIPHTEPRDSLRLNFLGD